VNDVDFPRATRQMLAVAGVLTLTGGAYFFFTAGARALWSFLFGAVVSTLLLALLARTLLLLDVTGEAGNTPKSTNALLAISQFAILGAVYVAVDRFPIHTNATAAGFGVAVLAATLQQGAALLKGR